jgi:hypothetical protein
MQRFLALGTKCLEFQTAADESKAKQSDNLLNGSLFVAQYLYWN